MAINTSRSARKTEEFLLSRQQTLDHVAPGTYENTHNEPKAPPGETAVPFCSLSEKVLNQNSSTSHITPGPGAFLGTDVPNGSGKKANGEEFLGHGATALRSGVARLGPTAPGSSIFTASTIAKNPGPGTYKPEGDLAKAIAKDPRGPVKPVLEVLDKTTPSIPMRKLLPGQEPTSEMGQADAANLCMRHTGEAVDMVGPGEYEPRGEHIVARSNPCPTFHLSKLTRKLWEPSAAIDCDQPPLGQPGPGAYETKAGIIPPDGSETGTYQFTSRAPMAHQSDGSEKPAPGPGQYDYVGELEQSARSARERTATQGDRSRFGGMSERVGWARSQTQPFKDPYHLRNVPGPGHYPDAASSFPDDPKRKEAEKALPDAMKKKFHGVHHPTIIMALQEAQGPLQAFNSTDDRPCNREPEQRTPAPWHYAKEDARDKSIQADLKEKAKIGRKGVFGTCADRFYGSPLNGKTGLPDPGDMPEGASGSISNPEPRSMFQSQSPRMYSSAGKGEIQCVSVGNHQTPAPGAYSIEKEPSYRSPFRHSRVDHLSFGSCHTRFEANKDVFFGHAPSLLNPGPGEYNDPDRPRVKGAARAKDKRRPPIVGCATDLVGPGSYGESTRTHMLKKTFNVSTQVPVNGTTPRRGPMTGSVV